MKLNYYVLWTENNLMLKNYLEKYYEKLKNDILKLCDYWILESEFRKLLISDNSKDFILNTEQSSIINFLTKEIVLWKKQHLWDKNLFIEKLKSQIEFFLTEWIDSSNLNMNLGSLIDWTNIRLTTNDSNPYNFLEAHPDHKNTGWMLSWWERKQEEWISVYNKTFLLLKNIDFWFYRELNYIINKIVPLWTSYWVHNSASYKEAIWHLYLWYTLDSLNPEINNLEAIIHESSHNKLNLIMQFDPVILNTTEQNYYSAIRPDARPIHWVFIWYHAFAPTMYIIMKAYKQWHFWDNKQWFEKIVLYYIKTKFLQKVIKKYAILTDLWKEISNEIDYVIMLMDNLIKELNPSKELLSEAKLIQLEHFKSVNFWYPNLRY